MSSRRRRFPLLTFMMMLVLQSSIVGQGANVHPPAIGSGSGAHTSSSSLEGNASLIVPGVGIGKLKLGDTQERTFKLFPPKADVDQEWKDKCGNMFNWMDSSNPHKGNLFILFRNGRVVQIGSATTRYHTVDALTAYDSPDKVQRYFKGLRAYALLRPSSAAFGNRPLVFWIDRNKGVAFELAYFPEERRRYLYEIIVFAPGGDFCPEGKATDSTNWRELPPYSLDLPDERAGNWELLFGQGASQRLMK